MANELLEFIAKNHQPVFFDIDADCSMLDCEKYMEEIHHGMNINDHILSFAPNTNTAASIGTLLGMPINLHNYPNIGFQKELSLRETIQKEIDKWLS